LIYTELNKEILKRVFIFTGHCNTEYKERVLIDLIKKTLFQYDGHSVYASHLKPSPQVLDLVDYSIYIKENLIENVDIKNDITSRFGMYFFDIPESGRTMFINLPNHGWAHHQLMSTSLRILDHKYEYYHFINYDADHNIISQIKEHERKCKEYDAYFYSFRYEPDKVNTECFTITEKVREKIQSVSRYEDYYHLGHHICEHNYTNMLKDFNVYNAGLYPFTDDHEIGSIIFNQNDGYDIRPLRGDKEYIHIMPYLSDSGRPNIAFIFLKDMKIVLRFFRDDSLIKEDTIHGNGGLLYIREGIENSICRIEVDNVPFCAFDMSKEYNYGKIIK